MRADMVPGASFPDYELSDHTGKHRKLSELQGGDPMVLDQGRKEYFYPYGKAYVETLGERD